MDSCQRFKEMISDYIEGGLDQQNKLQMEQHLRDCLNCKQAIGRLKSLIRNLKELPRRKVSPDFETILRARISVESGLARHRSEGIFSSWQIRIPAYALSVALIVLVILSVTSYVNRQNQSYPSEAYINSEMYGGTKQVDSSSNERIIYFIERQPAYEVIPKTPVTSRRNSPSNRSISSDSTQLQLNRRSKLERVNDIDPLIY